jgi:predicted phage tail protein
MAAGDSLIAVGMFGATSPAALQGVAAFALDGPAAPSGLRATPAGPGMRLEWNGLQPPPAGGYTIEAGSAAGLANLATLNVGSATAFSTPVPAGAFFVRVRTQGNEQSNEIVVRGGCSTPPPAPTALTAELAAGAVTLRWTAPIVMVDSYVIEAGSAAGLRNVASLTLPGAQTSVSAPAPPGTYFTRVRAANACGTSAASGETFFTVGSSASLPPAPTGLAATIAGLRLDLSWNAVAGATGYVIEAGSASGLADLAAITLGNATTFTAPAVPPGIYVVRVRAISPAGTGPPSSPDLLVRVP